MGTKGGAGSPGEVAVAVDLVALGEGRAVALRQPRHELLAGGSGPVSAVTPSFPFPSVPTLPPGGGAKSRSKAPRLANTKAHV